MKLHRLALLLLLPLLLLSLMNATSCVIHRSKGAAKREVIHTDQAPAAIGPYSQAIKIGNRLFVAVEGGIEAQTTQALKNIQAIVKAAGFRLKDAVQAQVFLLDLNDYGRMNKVYETFFRQAPPARAAVAVARLPRDALVEILVTLERTP